jgi:hypothetical protein
MAHWEFVVWAVNGLVGLSTWRNVPLAVVRLIGALTKDPQRSRQCAEIIKLSRKDAKDLPDYLPESHARDKPTAATDPPSAMKRPLRTSECRNRTTSGIVN